jgi:uncharacterized protein (DUF1778 family)
MPKLAYTERIDLRTSRGNKNAIQRAAALRNISISAYLVDAALARARTDIQNVEQMNLSDTDRDLFFSSLLTPPGPNEALKTLFSQESR